MNGFWKPGEIRLVQERTVTSGANDEYVAVGYPGVPEGKLWVVSAVSYMPSAAETQVIAFYKVSKVSTQFALLNPISMSLNPAVATFIEQGMEYLLFPGEYLAVRREDHTVGSTMSLTIQIIEVDLPLYSYDEPQTVLRQERAVSSLRSRLGGGLGGGVRGIVPPTLTGDRGGRAGPLQK